MMNAKSRHIFLSLLAFSGAVPGMAYEAMYERTPVGTIEVKTLPERIALETRTEGSYFAQDNGLFMRLFRYIDDNSIAMTVPVEAEPEPGAMRFFVGNRHQGTAPESTDVVEIVTLPARTVASIGMRGGYSQRNFKTGRKKVLRWLEEQTEWVADGEAYAVYWHGPFVPPWLKRSEVHLPLREMGTK